MVLAAAASAAAAVSVHAVVPASVPVVPAAAAAAAVPVLGQAAAARQVAIGAMVQRQVQSDLQVEQHLLPAYCPAGTYCAECLGTYQMAPLHAPGLQPAQSCCLVLP